MNYGLYLSASGVLTNQYRQDVFANNLANVNTVGFKPDIPTLRQRDPESVESHAPSAFHRQLLDRIGGGTVPGPQSLDFTPGAQQPTGNPLDVALSARDSFLAVRVDDAATGRSEVRLTRDGRMTIDAYGNLVTSAGGHAVLDDKDQPITLLPNLPAVINSEGRISQGGAAVGQLQVTGVRDEQQLLKKGQNLLGFAGRDLRTTARDATVRSGFVEGSGVDSIRALMNLIDANKALTLNANVLKFHDQTMDRAVNTLGRVG